MTSQRQGGLHKNALLSSTDEKEMIVELVTATAIVRSLNTDAGGFNV